MNDRIKEVFGQYIVQIKGKIETFLTLEEAETALEAVQGEERTFAEAGRFAEFVGFAAGTKGYNGKVNVIVAYLGWVEDGRPEPELEEEEVDIAEGF